MLGRYFALIMLRDTLRSVAVRRIMMMMIDNARALELVEQAEQETSLCACGQPVLPVARPEGVWIACASLVQPKGLLRRLVTLDFPVGHTEQLIFEWSTVEAAA
jgi:hypothetical protein